jgi:hypothetical protein
MNPFHFLFQTDFLNPVLVLGGVHVELENLVGAGAAQLAFDAVVQKEHEDSAMETTHLFVDLQSLVVGVGEHVLRLSQFGFTFPAVLGSETFAEGIRSSSIGGQ